MINRIAHSQQHAERLAHTDRFTQPLALRQHPEAVLFGQGQTTPAQKVGIAGFITMILGIGTGAGGYAVYGPKQTHPTEVVAVQGAERAVKKTTRGLLFDATAGSIKNGLVRFWSGDMATDKAKAVQAFKTGRNAEITVQDAVDPVLLDLANNTEAAPIIQGHVSRIRAERDAYYELMQRTIELAHDNPKSTIGKWIKDYRTSQLEKDTATLSEYDQATVGRLYMDFLNSQNGTPIERAEAFYQGYVQEVVQKHHPEQVATCQEAGHKLFGEIKAQGEINDIRNRLNLLGFSLGGLGLLGVILSLNLGTSNPGQSGKPE